MLKIQALSRVSYVFSKTKQQQYQRINKLPAKATSLKPTYKEAHFAFCETFG